MKNFYLNHIHDKLISNEIIEVDFIISLGGACRTAHYLRNHNLRHVANPLDWMFDYSLESVLHWFKNGFSDFFLEIEEDKNRENDGVGYRHIIDKNNFCRSYIIFH
jgi:hypothetical protein